MLRSYILLMIGMGAFYSGKGQAVQQVVGAGGGSSKAIGGYTIDFTVGETVILTAGTDPSCTQGFQQPLTIKDLPDSNLINAAWYIKIYPNPVHDQLTIHAYMDRAGRLDLRLVDILGRVIQVSQLSFGQGYNDAFLPFAALSRGIYILYISDPVHGRHQQLKLLKE
jgi:hypothetical protein